MTADQRSRLLAETQETAGRLNKLNEFMANPAFPKLPRKDKDLLYSQQRVMSKYVQILGKRLERAGEVFEHAKSEDSFTVQGGYAKSKMTPLPPLYGYCPICLSHGIIRERHPGGNDKCSEGHTYPSADALTELPKPKL